MEEGGGQWEWELVMVRDLHMDWQERWVGQMPFDICFLHIDEVPGLEGALWEWAEASGWLHWKSLQTEDVSHHL